jgi:hypothetical protein
MLHDIGVKACLRDEATLFSIIMKLKFVRLARRFFKMRTLFNFQVFPRLETEQFLLRDLLEADAPMLFTYFSDPEYTRYLSFDTHKELEQTKNSLNL